MASSGISTCKAKLPYLLKESLTEVDIELKAACYNVSKGNKENATIIIERVRRKLMVLEKKTEIALKDVKKEEENERKSRDKVEANLREQIKELWKKNSALSAEIKELKEFYVLPTSSLQEDELETPESSQPQTSQDVPKNPELMSQSQDEPKSPKLMSQID